MLRMEPTAFARIDARIAEQPDPKPSRQESDSAAGGTGLEWTRPMNAILFDTLKLVRTLRDKAKFSPEQAEGLADAMAEAMQGDIATKADIDGLRASNKADIQAVRADIDAQRAATKTDIDALRASTKTDIDALRTSTKADIESLRASTKADIQAVKADIDGLRTATKADFQAVRADIEALRASNKADIEALRAATKADVEKSELRLEAKIESTKSELVRWLFGAMGFQTIVTIGAAIALARAFAK